MSRFLPKTISSLLLAMVLFAGQGRAVPVELADQGHWTTEAAAPDQSPGGTSRVPDPETDAAEGPSSGQTTNRERISDTRSGVLATKDGLRLRLVTDIGNVRVQVKESGQVSYSVRIETDARQPDARALIEQFVVTARTTPTGVTLTGQVPTREYRGRRWVELEVNVPRDYELDIQTGAGNIQIEDIEGRVSLVTSGGNISAGRVGGPGGAGARLETQGGHISVREVKGDLRAITAGGLITADMVRGDATLRTGGGHVRAGSITGVARLETGGGNISVQRALAEVTAITGGGQVDIGEAGGPIRARTGGGVVRVQRVSGPADVNTGGGSIYLSEIQQAVRASTGAGSITAFFVPEAKLTGPSQLISGQGDVVVYLPQKLAITINAVIETPAGHRIVADPQLPLQVSCLHSGDGQPEVRGECTLNGGGEVLRIRTTAGNIRLKLADPSMQLRQQEIQKKRLKQREELQPKHPMQHEQEAMAQAQIYQERSRLAEEQARQAVEQVNREVSRLAALQQRFERLFIGGVRVDPEEQQKRLIHYVAPDYPDVARDAGIEGSVRLQVVVAEDGSVSDVRVQRGERILADAALAAVQQWRYEPTVIEGKSVKVVSRVTVVFRLD